MTLLNSLRIGAVAAIVLILGIEPVQTAPGDPVISQVPLSQQSRIPPNIMFILDDSGSMAPDGGWVMDVPDFNIAGPGSVDSNDGGDDDDLTFDDGDNNRDIRKFAYTNNSLFYNPAITYRPWRNSDGSYMADTPYDEAFSDRSLLTQKVDLGDKGRAFHVPKSGTVDKTQAENYFRYRFNDDGSSDRCEWLYAGSWGWRNCKALTEFSWTTASGTLTRSLADEKANFANWFSYHRTRMKAAKAGAGYAFADLGEDVRVGFDTIWNRNALNIPVGSDDGLFRNDGASTNRSDWFDRLYAAVGNDRTPLHSALERTGKYFENTASNGPWGGSGNVQLSCRRNFAILTTDGYWNANQRGSNEDNTAGTSIPRADPTQGPDYAYTPGNPYMDTHTGTLADMAMRYWKKDLRTDMPNNVPTSTSNPAYWQHMTMFGISIGLRGSLNPATDLPALTDGTLSWPNPLDTEDNHRIDDLWHATVNGHGKFVAATSPDEFTRGLREILAGADGGTSPSGSIAGSGARVPGGDLALTIEPSYAANGFNWTGDVVASRVESDGTEGNVRWSAATQLMGKAPTTRRIFTALAPGAAVSAGGSLSVVGFEAANLGADEASKKKTLGANFTHTTKDYPSATSDQIVAFLRGDSAQEVRNGGPFRNRNETGDNRSRILGDIVNSSPIISASADNYGYLGASQKDSLLSGYEDYLKTKDGRDPVVYVGANDGMFHAFDAETGNEQFAYVPNSALSNLGQLPRQEYAHRYYVDGTPVVADAKYDGSWHTVAVGTTGAGGRSVFALNVDSPDAFAAGDVLWEFSDGAGVGRDADLGATFSKPIVVPLENDEWGVIFGNGYGNDSNDPVLYVVRLKTGELIGKLKPTDGSTGYNGLGQVAAIDSDGNGRADTVYGGDLQGHIWKFDISDTSPGGWKVALDDKALFTATSNLGIPQPITGALEVTVGPGGGYTVLFGTGRYFAVGDNQIPPAPRIDTLYGVWDPWTGAAELTRANLTAQYIDEETEVEVDEDGDPNTEPVRRDMRTTTANPLAPGGQFGFFIDLALDTSSGSPPSYVAKGELFVGAPRVQNGKVFFTTFEPNDGSNPCNPGGRNWIYALNVVTGAAAMQNVRMNFGGDPVCTGNCGAIAISEADTPVTETSMFIPKITQCDPADPTCDLKKMLELQLQQCTLVIRAAGSPPLILPRPCGRQSWRQVQ